jgi:hypothetical protein
MAKSGYRVLLKHPHRPNEPGRWFDVPNSVVIDRQNLSGIAMVWWWPSYAPMEVGPPCGAASFRDPVDDHHCYIGNNTRPRYNGTGSSFTPSLLLGTPAAEDDFTTVTNRLTQVLGACANGVFTQVSFSPNISAYTNIKNGLQVEFQIPTGVLLASKDVKITEVSLQPGSLPTIFERPPISVTLGLCLPYYQKPFPYATAPSSNLGSFNGAVVTVTASTSAGSGAESVKFLPPMRATPTITTYNTKASNANWWDSTASASRTFASADITEKSMRLTVNAATTAAAQHFIQWQAVAEL